MARQALVVPEAVGEVELVSPDALLTEAFEVVAAAFDATA